MTLINTLFFLFTNFILFIKLIIFILVKLFLLSDPYAKIFILIILLYFLYLLLKYPRQKFKKLSEYRNYKMYILLKYALKTSLQHFYNYFIILFFICFSFIFIFYLRFYNRDKVINLSENYFILENLIKKTAFIECLLNICLFLLFVICYILILIKLTKYFKFHIMKRHLYIIKGFMQVDDVDNWYILKFLNKIKKINIYNIHFKFVWKIEDIYTEFYNNKKKILPDNYTTMTQEQQKYYDLQKPVHPYYFLRRYKIDRIIFHFMTKWHYLLLIIVFIYDLIYNNFQIKIVFYILPWTLFFDLYLRCSKFIEGLWFPHDQFLHTILYCHSIEIWDKQTLLIDGDFYDYNKAKIIYRTYVARDFVKDPNYL